MVNRSLINVVFIAHRKLAAGQQHHWRFEVTTEGPLVLDKLRMPERPERSARLNSHPKVESRILTLSQQPAPKPHLSAVVGSQGRRPARQRGMDRFEPIDDAVVFRHLGAHEHRLFPAGGRRSGQWVILEQAVYDGIEVTIVVGPREAYEFIVAVRPRFGPRPRRQVFLVGVGVQTRSCWCADR